MREPHVNPSPTPWAKHSYKVDPLLIKTFLKANNTKEEPNGVSTSNCGIV